VFVQVSALQTASDDPEPSLITSKWHNFVPFGDDLRIQK